jgi:Methyltransferase domain
MTENGLRGEDPGEWGVSLANLREVFEAILETAGVRTITEVGAYAGDLTRDLADWVEGRGGEVIAIDPQPQPALIQLDEERESVTLVREPSHQALRGAPRTDAVVIDGDHNYFTVYGELEIVAERFPGDELPLLLLHDVRWPHARRDAYFAPDAIPDAERHDVVSGPVFPGVSELAPGGLPFKHVAAEEGGPRNGVLTALEDFLAERPGLRLAVVPAFFGLGVVWEADADWAGELERLLEPWNGNPWMERLEQHRVYTLARVYNEIMRMQTEIDRLRAVNGRKIELMEDLVESRAFGVGERLARLRSRNGVSWGDQLRALIRER